MDKEIIFSCIKQSPGAIAGLTGAVIAFIELSSRFPGSLKRIFLNYTTWIYLSLNAITSYLFFCIALIFDIKISNISINDYPILGAFIIGLISMGLLRSSLININIKGANYNYGIGNAIQKILKWAETLYDRDKSKILIKDVDLLVPDISFEIMHKEIVPICIAAFSYPIEDDNNEINRQIGLLKEIDDMTEEAKVISLALTVANKIGIDILKQCVIDYKNRKKENMDDDKYKNIKNRIQLLLDQQEKLRTSIRTSIKTQGENKNEQ
jgi:hypothetical protein